MRSDPVEAVENDKLVAFVGFHHPNLVFDVCPVDVFHVIGSKARFGKGLLDETVGDRQVLWVGMVDVVGDHFNDVLL